MNTMKTFSRWTLLVAALAVACSKAGAQLPADFPLLNVTNRGGTAPGYLIGNIGGRTADNTKLYYVILDNTGTNAVFASKTNTLYRFVTPQGFDAVSGGGVFSFKDENLNVADTVRTLGFTLDAHDVKLWPNGHALVFAQEFATVDMSQLVAGGKTAANITGNVIQEIDTNKRVVFEWHTFDHIAITNTFANMTQSSFDYAHINAMTIDPIDNQLLVSVRTTSEIVKINRSTGQIIWRLGGRMNQFTFVGEHEENAPYYTVGQHDVHRLANGNLLFFDNGNISGGGVTSSDRTYSRVVEYALDETNLIATLVWEYRHTPDILANCTGSLKRFANGNTLIDWGCAVPTSGTVVTEVDATGQVVFEITHRQTGGIGSVQLGGGLTKQVWNRPDLVCSATNQNIQAGQTYASVEAGVSVTINNLSADAENALVVRRHLDAIRFPQFAGKAPQVVMEHVVLAGSNITTLEAGLDLSLPDTSYVFDTPMIHDPAELVVYHRATPGQGLFTAMPTTYDADTQKLRVITTQLGEFIFGYADIAETPIAPEIASPVDQSEVNQAAPVVMVWKPQGLIGSSELQVATDAAFANLVLNTNDLGSNNFALQNPLPSTQYFWRVRVVNQGGTSDWASASFMTVPPILQLTYPAGGEVWKRFQVVTIRWTDNIAENVALDIYKGGVSNRTFSASTASSGFFTWTVGQFQAFAPGSDYTIKIRSTTNPSLFDFSEPFCMVEPPVINSSSVNRLPDGRMLFAFTAPGAATATVLGSTNLLDWQPLLTLIPTNGSAVFIDDTAGNFPNRFYRVRTP